MSEKIRGKRLLSRWLPLPAMGGVVMAAACSAPGKGALIMAISTDMQAPKDISTVSIFVTEGANVKFDYVGLVSPTGSVSLPSTLAIVEPDDPSTQIQIRVIGFNKQTARVLRDIQTTVPHQRTGLLRVPLDFIDTSSVPSTGDTMLMDMFYPGGVDGVAEGISSFDPDTISSTCDPMNLCALRGTCMTTVNGSCATAAVDSTTLPDYDDSLVFGASGNPNVGCFDVDSCFSSPVAVTNVTFGAAGTTCSFPLPSTGGSSDAGTKEEGDAGAPIDAAVDGAIESHDASEPDAAVVDASGGDFGGAPDSGTTAPTDSGETAGGTFSDGGDAPADAAVQLAEIALSAPVDAGLSTDMGNDAGASSGNTTAGSTSDGGTTGTAGGTVSGSTASTANLNFALISPQGLGVCNAGLCLVPVENDPSAGWSVTGNTVTLAAGVCSQLMAQTAPAQLVMVNGGCVTKTESQPVCEPGEAIDGGVSSEEDGSATALPDASVLAHDGGSSSTGGGSAPDAGSTNIGTSSGGSSGGSTGQPGLDAGSTSTSPPDASVADAASSSILSGVATLVAGPNTTCAILQDGNVDCWGLLLGFAEPTPSPVAGFSGASVGTLGGNSQATTGFACTSEPGALLCEGSNESGELGNGTLTDSASPVVVEGLGGVSSMGAGTAFACALTGGTVYCWGDNTYGQIGSGTTATSVTSPMTPVTGIPSATALAVGSDFACALVQGGYVYCWGDNSSGILGSDEAGASSNVPILVNGFGSEVLSTITAGESHACALTEAGSVYCWGDNSFNQLGMGGASLASSPTPVTSVPAESITAISAGGNTTCALAHGTQVACWGSNVDGQLGSTAGGDTSAAPVISGVNNATGIAVGGDHACALIQGGTVECWGYNTYGQIGTGQATTANVTSPVFVTAASAVAAGDDGGSAKP